MAEATDVKTWAILEVMGHKRYAGEVSEQVIAGAGFVRIDVPKVTARGTDFPAFSKVFGTSSIYCLTPTDEATARAAAAAFTERPVDLWTIEQGQRALTGKVKCDGDHPGPVCADPECWLRDPDTGEPWKPGQAMTATADDDDVDCGSCGQTWHADEIDSDGDCPECSEMPHESADLRGDGSPA